MLDFRSGSRAEMLTSSRYGPLFLRQPYHRVHVRHVDEGKSRILMSHSPQETIGSRGVSNTLRQWLTQSSRFGHQQWYTAEEWRQGVGGSATPW
jgi:hypothetical protein